VDWELLLEHALLYAGAQVVLLTVSVCAMLLATIGGRRGWKSSKWLATVGLAAPIAALALTLVDMAVGYRRVLELLGLLGSVRPPAPLDQLSTAIVRQLPEVRERLLVPIGLLMPAVTWVWGRVHWPEEQLRGRRWLAMLAALMVTLTTWGICWWWSEFIHQGFVNVACESNGVRTDASLAALERVRLGVMVAGGLLGLFGVVYGVMQARKGAMLRMDSWLPVLAFVSLASVAKLWTSDERRDTQAAFVWQPNGHGGWHVLKGHADDPHEGPALEHCTFDWTGMNVLYMKYAWRTSQVENWGHWIDFCVEDNGIGPILAEPELPIGDIVPALQSSLDHGYSRFGVASVRPIPTDRATTDEFLRLRTCVVEFAVGEEGVPIERFTTWGELAEAADAAEGALVVSLPHELVVLPRSPAPLPDPDEDESPSLWAPYRAFPDAFPED
jgi:hypothetical protein